MNQLDRLKAAFAGSYEIEREVGAGGMATVYLARDLKHDRRVAIKVLRPELAAALGPDRFPREIRIVAQLQHPHVLPLHDSGQSDGFLYYVMPFVEGESLRKKLDREGQLPVHDAVRILREVVDALAYAHGLGILHRDTARSTSSSRAPTWMRRASPTWGTAGAGASGRSSSRSSLA